jgi:hypothetical protein
MRLLRIFLWISVLGSGIGLGAKIFDLMVLAGAWGAAPPTSLALLPYGPRFPFDPGEFFQPLSLVMVIGVTGALIAGWKTPFEYRKWLLVPVVTLVIIWAITPTVFWPMIGELYGTATGRVVKSDAEAVALVRKWVVWDWWRVALIAAGFVSSVQALSRFFEVSAFPGARHSHSPTG